MKANEVTVEFLKATYLGFLSVDEAPQRIPNRPFFSEPLGRFKGKNSGTSVRAYKETALSCSEVEQRKN